MSTGGTYPHPSLMPETTRVDLEHAWRDREAEAVLLIAGGRPLMALALRLYALEIRLKLSICKRLNLDNLPKACKTHDLPELVIFTGLWADLSDPANRDVRLSWDLLAEFSKKRLNNVRYQPAASFDAVESAELTTALDDPTKGVLAWLSRYP